MAIPKHPFKVYTPARDGRYFVVVPVHTKHAAELTGAGVLEQYITAPCYLYWHLVMVPCGNTLESQAAIFEHMIAMTNTYDSSEFFAYMCNCLTNKKLIA